MTRHVVVDTNVAVNANERGSGSIECEMACAEALYALMSGDGTVCLDEAGEISSPRILTEYFKRLSGSGEPGVGDKFFNMILKSRIPIYWVRITEKPGVENDFAELPAPPQGVEYDPSDRKFLAVAHAAEPKAEILQATDSKWWGWRQALADIGVKVQFLCEEEIKAKYAQKMGSPP